MFGLIAYVALGWVLYIAFPNYGEFVEWAEGGITVSRMGGAAHPNVFSRAALFLVLISTYLYRSGSLPVRYWIPIFLWASVTLYLAMSRAAILTCGVALMMLWWDRLLSVQAILLVMVLGMALTSGLITLVAMGHGDKIQRKLVSMVTKSDDLEEVKSATGRSAIWAEARRLIALRPWFGYGLNSSPLLLVDYNQHTHNILLNPALSAGIPAAVLLGCVLVWNLFHLFGSTNLFVRAICLYVLFSGVVEDTIIETFPATGTVIWLVATLWPVMVAANMVRESEYNGSHASADAVPLGA